MRRVCGITVVFPEVFGHADHWAGYRDLDEMWGRSVGENGSSTRRRVRPQGDTDGGVFHMNKVSGATK